MIKYQKLIPHTRLDSGRNRNYFLFISGSNSKNYGLQRSENREDRFLRRLVTDNTYHYFRSVSGYDTFQIQRMLRSI